MEMMFRDRTATVVVSRIRRKCLDMGRRRRWDGGGGGKSSAAEMFRDRTTTEMGRRRRW
ncbi:hypothetical protein HanIR_Chr10g0481631 [Helianthus annuus]|nr:hypothetical protein HanIR_Chr10g0481631 [Helianthus annuus]KAJ0530368.1 hypothetical protein HanHA89_Chr10g0389131 [Helianthus annuus]